jgi:hypothetical protein
MAARRRVSKSGLVTVGRLLGGRRARLAEEVLHEPFVLTALRQRLDQHLLVDVAQKRVHLLVGGIGRDVLLELRQRVGVAVLLVRLHGVLEGFALGPCSSRRAERTRERRGAREREEKGTKARCLHRGPPYDDRS